MKMYYCNINIIIIGKNALFASQSYKYLPKYEQL